MLFFDSLKHIRCNLGIPHKITEATEHDLYKSALKEIITTCGRCQAELKLKVDPNNQKEYVVVEI